jgi:hypothetical protein
MTVEDQRAQRAPADPVFTESMTSAECQAEMERWLADCQAQSKRLDEEHLLLGIGRTAAICMTHELIWPWKTATADRWFRALPERYMTPDSLARPDWDHSHYPHDKHGRIGRVTTLQRPATQPGTRAEQLIDAILADLASDPEDSRQPEHHEQEH